jgi:hypothetical protein
VGAGWTCTSAEYVVYTLKKYILIAGSVLWTASCLGTPDIVLMIEGWSLMGYYAVSWVSCSWNFEGMCGLNPHRWRGSRLCSLNLSPADTLLHPTRQCSETVVWEHICCYYVVCIS